MDNDKFDMKQVGTGDTICLLRDFVLFARNWIFFCA
jgi:hypothetical protein